MKSTEKMADRAGAVRMLSTAPREQMIAEAAYFRALERNFQGGNSLEDWYAAEREIDSILLARQERTPLLQAPSPALTQRAGTSKRVAATTNATKAR
jgi:DUF2934 family protein